MNNAGANSGPIPYEALPRGLYMNSGSGLIQINRADSVRQHRVLRKYTGAAGLCIGWPWSGSWIQAGLGAARSRSESAGARNAHSRSLAGQSFSKNADGAILQLAISNCTRLQSPRLDFSA